MSLNAGTNFSPYGIKHIRLLRSQESRVANGSVIHHVE